MFLSALAWSLLEHEFRDAVGVFEYFFVRYGRTNARHDTFAHACQNGVLSGTAYQLVDVGAHRHACLGYELDAVLGNSGYRRCVYHFGVDGSLYGFKNITAGQVDGSSLLEREIYVGFGG